MNRALSIFLSLRGENHTITRRRPEVVRLVVEFFREKLM